MRRNPLGKHVQQEPADEFLGGQGHRFDLVASAIVFPLEPDLIVFDVEQAVIGDGDAMGIAAQVIEYLFGSSERSFGIDHPLALFHGSQIRVNAIRSCSGSSVPKNFSLPESKAFLSDRETAAGTEKIAPGRAGRTGWKATQRLPSSEIPPPGTTQCRCG